MKLLKGKCLELVESLRKSTVYVCSTGWSERKLLAWCQLDIPRCTFLGFLTSQHQFEVQEKGYGKVSSAELLQPGRLLLCPRLRKKFNAAHFGSCVSGCVPLRRLLVSDLRRCVATNVVLFTHVLWMLTKWFQSTRLETRTKESNMYASVWVVKPVRVMKVILVGSARCTIDRS